MFAIDVCARQYADSNGTAVGCTGDGGASPGALYVAAVFWAIGTLIGTGSADFGPSPNR